MLILERYDESTRNWHVVATTETVASVVADPHQEDRDAEELLRDTGDGRTYRVVKLVRTRGPDSSSGVNTRAF